ncbi:MAG: iron-sulfur cluster assembly protein [Methanosphaera sp.]|uniref:metal-sulfur cluster assembly factor n=1 Tax=Methanosphaera sp. TaxID=2666342 RepID=UPI002E789486|nr:iron-sulfur cluster assembly protein [Methanosphaera sp.]MEE1118237.1 iron-sulfur cluster assembly protein [Methanosphaera sp.]MEE3324658.1 iron-sulfur cluster assembly protein [Methanosphaera sp.]
MAEAEIKEKLNDKLAGIADPHMGISIVEMGLIQNIEVDEANKKAVITVKPTNPMCMSVANIAMAVRIEAEKLDEIDKAEINVIDHMMSNEVNEMVNKDE